ncbi:hypothetical protein [Mycolicibacterium smegmatis]|uniref:hypothetical protein n=1 Tax=Mycolicibacterium smegmatis TaxID=1772 RepID=UPI0013032670|nr:hypothetical protein [Mycolicibacterium smegmatis]
MVGADTRGLRHEAGPQAVRAETGHHLGIEPRPLCPSYHQSVDFSADSGHFGSIRGVDPADMRKRVYDYEDIHDDGGHQDEDQDQDRE